MADWQNPADYPFIAPSKKTSKNELTQQGVAITSAREWAWEFLRRNPEYRERYKAFREQADALEKDYGSHWRMTEYATVYVPERLPSETVSSTSTLWLPDAGERAWIRRCDDAGLTPRKLGLEQWYAEKWGLRDRMGDPSEGIKPDIRFLPSPYPRRIETIETAQNLFCDQGVDDGSSAELLIQPGLAVIAFDLRTAIAPQLTKARKLLAAAKASKAVTVQEALHKHKGEWVKYLRALDADEAGAPKAEIAKALGLNLGTTASAQGYDWLKAAKFLRDEAYRYIASE